MALLICSNNEKSPSPLFSNICGNARITLLRTLALSPSRRIVFSSNAVPNSNAVNRSLPVAVSRPLSTNAALSRSEMMPSAINLLTNSNGARLSPKNASTVSNSCTAAIICPTASGVSLRTFAAALAVFDCVCCSFWLNRAKVVVLYGKRSSVINTTRALGTLSTCSAVKPNCVAFSMSASLYAPSVPLAAAN